jgi:uncharacterized protein (TIGR02466 family)
MPVELWWPTPIYYSLFDEPDDSQSAISAEIDAAIGSVTLNTPWTQAKMTSSFSYENRNMFLDNTPKLKNYVIKHVKNYFADADLFIAESWINVGGKDSYQEPHEHLFSFISGCYYHKTSTSDGDIVFNCNDKLLRQLMKRSNKSYNDLIRYSPQVGKIILFPSYLTHHVNINQTDDERISVAFNIMCSQSPESW